MTYIYGRFLPREQKIQYALTEIYGLGAFAAELLSSRIGLSPQMLVRNLSEQDISNIVYLLGKEYSVEGELKKLQRNDVRRLVKIRSYRGLRHKQSLPSRGQRTHSNARTRRKLGKI